MWESGSGADGAGVIGMRVESAHTLLPGIELGTFRCQFLKLQKYT